MKTLLNINDYINLYVSLDFGLRSVLTTLFIISNQFADDSGWFTVSNRKLQELLGISKNPTIAAIETLYRWQLLDVKVTPFTVNGRERSNQYRLKVENFNKDYKGKSIETLNYHAKDYHVTYTGNTTTEKPISSPQEPPKEVTLTTIHTKGKEPQKAFKMAETRIERRALITPFQRLQKIERNAITLCEKMEKATSIDDYNDMMKKYKEWLDKKFAEVDDTNDLKFKLMGRAVHIIDNLRFDDDDDKGVNDNDANDDDANRIIDELFANTNTDNVPTFEDYVKNI